MWERKVLKRKGKEAFKRNFWKCVIAAFLTVILVEGIKNAAISATYINGDTKLVLDGKNLEISGSAADLVLGYLAIITGTLGILYQALKIFVLEVLQVGGCKFFLENAKKPAGLGLVLSGFTSGRYMNVVVIQFMRRIYIKLWSLLFLIPGIVKAYSYCMVPYLLAENPEISQKEAFRISRRMMDGNKWNMFVLDMSFLGWHILSAFTGGIVGLFYTEPYHSAARAELYLALKETGTAK